MFDVTTAMNLNLWENFIESIAQVLSRALTDEETERFLASFKSLQARLRELSSENLKRLKAQPGRGQAFCKHQGTCDQNVTRGLIRAFVVVYLVKYSLGLFPALLTGRVFKKPSTLLKIGGKDTLSFAAFVSMYISSYKGLLCLMRRVRKRSDPANSFVAGTFAGLSLLLDSNRSRRLMISLYLSTRTLHFVCRWIWIRHFHKNFVERYLEPEESETLDTARIPEPPTGQSVVWTTPDEGTASERNSAVSMPDSDAMSPGTRNLSQLHNGIMDSDGNLLEEVPKRVLNGRFRMFLKQSAATIVMALSSSQILYAFVCEPDSLARSYLSFLLVHGGIRSLQPTKARQYLEAFGAVISSGQIVDTTKFLSAPENSLLLTRKECELIIPEGVPTDPLVEFIPHIMQLPHEYIMCGLQHPTTLKCSLNAVQAFHNEWWRAMSLYTPLNAIMVVIFRGSALFKDPLQTLSRLAVSILRSSLFLTCYVTTAWTLPCYLRRFSGTDRQWHYYINGILAGMMVLIEVPGRRLELALYCMPRALESFWNCGVKWKWWKNIPGGEAIYFCFATGVLMTFYQNDPAIIHDGYRKVMVRFLGIN